MVRFKFTPFSRFLRGKRLYACAIGLALIGCGGNPDSRRTGVSNLSFKAVEGIRYSEIRREFDNHTAFNDAGFEQVPEWELFFEPGDSVSIYSPFEKHFIGYPIYFDHDSVFNTARQWLRLKALTRDSMVFQLLQLKGKEVIKEKSNVFMRFYSSTYIKAMLHTSAAELRRHRAADTAYIRKLSARSNRNPGSADSSFAATTPALLESNSPMADVELVKPLKNILDEAKASDRYMYPEYKIMIKRAYRDFFYKFLVVIDADGKIHFSDFLTVQMDPENRKKVLQTIIDGYLQPLLKITPGNTIGIRHGSVVTLSISGKSSF